jgi:aminoglycoside phosphotransferase
MTAEQDAMWLAVLRAAGRAERVATFAADWQSAPAAALAGEAAALCWLAAEAAGAMDAAMVQRHCADQCVRIQAVCGRREHLAGAERLAP